MKIMPNFIFLVLIPRSRYYHISFRDAPEPHKLNQNLTFQVNPPGFQMIRLPFLDDLRHPEKISSAVSSHVPRASSTQIDLAGNVIKALSLSKRFSSTDVANPHLQQHYRALEVLGAPVARGITGHVELPASQLLLSKLDDINCFCDICRQSLCRS